MYYSPFILSLPSTVKAFLKIARDKAMVFSKRLIISEKRTTGQGLGWIKNSFANKRDLCDCALVSGIMMDFKRGRGVVA